MVQDKNRLFIMNSTVEENKLITNRVDAFDQIAMANQDRLAYDEMGRSTTYGELKAAADSLAAWLDQQSLPDHSPILVFGDHQYEMLASFWAALKTGHSYIPVAADSALPRLQSILATGKTRLVLAIEEFPSKQIVVNDPVIDREASTPDIHPTVQVDDPTSHPGAAPAYIHFTQDPHGTH